MTDRIDTRLAQAERPCLGPILKKQQSDVNPDAVLLGICQSLLFFDDGKSDSWYPALLHLRSYGVVDVICTKRTPSYAPDWDRPAPRT